MKISTLEHFNKLFQVMPGEEMQVIEQVFMFVHEMKSFLKVARGRLGYTEESGVNVVLDSVIKCLKRS